MALRHTVNIEGGYSNHPDDPGKATKYGITEKVARENGYRGDMRDLPLAFAEGVYKAQYWDLIHLDAVANLAAPIAMELFDTAVNCGVGFAAKSLQQALNALNRNATDYEDIAEDGLIGPRTMRALKAFIDRRGHEGVQVFLTALNVLQGAHYLRIANEAFTYGWLKNRVAF